MAQLRTSRDKTRGLVSVHGDNVNVDMASLYAPFLEYVPKGGAILDVGA